MKIVNTQRTVTPKVGKPELWFMCFACCLMVFNVCEKFHENMSSGFKVMEWTRKLLKDTHTQRKDKNYIPHGILHMPGPGPVAQSVGHPTRKSGVLGSIPSLATYFCFSLRFFKKGSCQLLTKVCVNRLGGLSLPWKSVVRLTDRPDMILDVYRGRKTTIQQQQHMPGV